MSSLQHHNTNVKPRWQHDCDKCILLLGNHKWTGPHYKGEVHDYYFCRGQFRPTVIARFGDEGSHYMSGLFPKATGPLFKALCLAKEQGLLKEGNLGHCNATDWEAFELYCDTDGKEGDVDKMCGKPLTLHEFTNPKKHSQSYYCGECRRNYSRMTTRIRKSNERINAKLKKEMANETSSDKAS